MTISFKAIEDPGVTDIARVLEIEQEAFGSGALNEYIVVPLMRYGKVYVAVDEEDNAIASAYFMRNLNDIDEAYLVSVAVLPAFRGQDVGTELLRFGIDYLREIGITRVRLTVDPANFTALSVYREKLDFTVIGSSKDEYGEGEDRLVMAKEL